jgi:hypothetical protein
MGKTITGELTKTVTVGVGGYISPLTVSSSGSVEPTAAGSDGILLPAGGAGAVIVNDGFIIAAETSFGVYSVGVALNAAGTLTNTGIIQGGAGGYHETSPGYGDGENGGAGVTGVAGVTVNNATGLIVGGAGSYGDQGAGAGGDGVILSGAGATLTNADVNGFIVGITGGAGASGFYYSNHGGTGVALLAGAYGSNASFISGGAGGSLKSGSGAGGGGDGVDLTGAKMKNLAAGRIIGGAGGNGEVYAFNPGGGGDGVLVQSVNGATSILANYGTVIGGAGGSMIDAALQGNAANGGAGVSLSGSGAGFLNYGTVTGGAGGNTSLPQYSGTNFYAGRGGFGVLLTAGATGQNYGAITGGGGGGGSGGVSGAYGGIVVALETGAFFNYGTLTGGTGGVSAEGFTAPGGIGAYDVAGYFYNNGGKIFGGKGAFGVVATSNNGNFKGTASVVNAGTITGGNISVGLVAVYAVNIRNTGEILGGYGAGQGANLIGGPRGAPTLLNLGIISGGNAYGAAAVPQAGGVGVVVQSATLLNAGTITGGAGSFGEGSTQYTGQGGDGVVISNGVVIDAGTIAAGAPGQGPAGYAVTFQAAGTLALLTGARIIGEVMGNAADADVLEFAGAGTQAGIGTQFIGIDDISFVSGADWTIAGNAAGLTSAQQISGFAAGDAIVLDGFTNTGMPALAGGVLTLDDAGSNAEMTFATPLSGDLLITDGGGNTTLAMLAVTSGVTLAAGVDEIVLAGGTASKLTVDLGSELTVADGGKLTSVAVQGVVSVASGGIATDVSVAKGGDLAVTGGKADNITIAAGGAAYFNGGVASNTTLTGGLMELLDDAKLSGTFGFKGSGGVLLIEQKQLPTLVISGFAAGDAIYLADAAASGKVKVTADGELTISAGGKSYKLDIAGAKKGSTDYVFSDHTLTEKPAKMAFARPVASAAPAPAALPELVAAGGFQAMAAPTMSPISAAVSAYGGLIFEPLQVPNGGIQTMVTLQN